MYLGTQKVFMRVHVASVLPGADQEVLIHLNKVKSVDGLKTQVSQQLRN